MKKDRVWPAVLGELQLQLGARRFAWLRDSTGSHQANGNFVVSVAGDIAEVDLLAVKQIAERTASRLLGEAVCIEFVVQPGEQRQICPVRASKVVEPPAPSYDYDVHQAGWFPVSEYECRFWAPFLGRVAWRVWEIVRRADKRKTKTAWTPRRRWTAPALAEMVPCGRQAVLGVYRRCEPDEVGAMRIEGVWRVRQSGAFDRLQAAGVAVITRQGLQRHTSYWLSVRVQMGLLSPAHVRMLAARLQVQHDRWLEDHGFDPLEWNGSNGV